MALSHLLDLDDEYLQHLADGVYADDEGEPFFSPFLGMLPSMAQTTRMNPKSAARPTPKRAATPQKKPATRSNSTGEGFCGYPALMGVIYGPSGVGKTSVAANFPDPVFIVDPKEKGINDLVAYKQCPEPVDIIEVDTFDLLLEKVRAVANGKYDCKTLALDSMTGFELLCFQHHCRVHFENNWSSQGFYAFQQGPKNAAKTDWPEFLDTLCDVQASGINVLLLGHSQSKTFINPEGGDYERYFPYLDKETWAQTHRWAQFVWFYNYYVEVGGKGIKKKANLDTEVRNIYTVHSAAFDAKQRFGLDPVIPAGDSGASAFEAIVTAFKAL